MCVVHGVIQVCLCVCVCGTWGDTGMPVCVCGTWGDSLCSRPGDLEWRHGNAHISATHVPPGVVVAQSSEVQNKIDDSTVVTLHRH